MVYFYTCNYKRFMRYCLHVLHSYKSIINFQVLCDTNNAFYFPSKRIFHIYLQLRIIVKESL